MLTATAGCPVPYFACRHRSQAAWRGVAWLGVIQNFTLSLLSPPPQALEEVGELDNTFVSYVPDNGGCTCRWCTCRYCSCQPTGS